MVLILGYPDNWTEIAATVKQSAGYRCNRCGLKCLPPNNSYRHLDLSLRRKLSAQVHHLDGNPCHFTHKMAEKARLCFTSLSTSS